MRCDFQRYLADPIAAIWLVLCTRRPGRRSWCRAPARLCGWGRALCLTSPLVAGTVMGCHRLAGPAWNRPSQRRDRGGPLRCATRKDRLRTGWRWSAGTCRTGCRCLMRPPQRACRSAPRVGGWRRTGWVARRGWPGPGGPIVGAAGSPRSWWRRSRGWCCGNRRRAWPRCIGRRSRWPPGTGGRYRATRPCTPSSPASAPT